MDAKFMNFTSQPRFQLSCLVPLIIGKQGKKIALCLQPPDKNDALLELGNVQKRTKTRLT